MFKKLLNWWRSRGQRTVRYPMHGTMRLPSGGGGREILAPTRFLNGASQERHAIEVMRALATTTQDQPASGESDGSSFRGRNSRLARRGGASRRRS